MDKRWVWSVLGRQLLDAWPTAAVIAVPAIVDYLLGDRPTRWVRHPFENQLVTAAQVVPAIVIAIFVFAVGTLFVVAQVVPPARGTRAVEVLRGRHARWTISPALVLAPGSALVLALDDKPGGILASGLLLGAVLYLLVSTACLLDIVREATDPVEFGRLMQRKHTKATKPLKSADGLELQQESSALKERPTRTDRRWSKAQEAADELYDVARTLRGWARTAATAGDSRELQLALDATLTMVDDYVTDNQRWPVLPMAYWDGATKRMISSPHSEDEGPSQDPDEDKRICRFRWWFPEQLRLAPCSPSAPNRQGVDGTGVLPSRWVANEVGRSLVRAVEFATTTKTLLDRDRWRLLLTMDKAARRFRDAQDFAGAGIMIAYVIELGLGARRCPSAEIDWHFDPLATLARLHQAFDNNGDDRDLAIGTAAGVLKVADAIVAARARDHFERRSEAWGGEVDGSFDVDTIVRRTVAELKAIPGLEDFGLFAKTLEKRRPGRAATALAKTTWFEPRGLPFILPTNKRIVCRLENLLRPAVHVVAG